MLMLPLLVFLLSLLLQPVAAASPIMEHTLSNSSLDSFYDSDAMLNTWCELCGPYQICQCFQATMHEAPFVAANLLRHCSDYLPTVAPQPDFVQPEGDLGPIIEYINGSDITRQPLNNELIQFFDEEGTTVQPSTVQVYIEETYNVGDRQRTSSRRGPPHRRQDRRTGGYPCDVDGCEKTFDRACERTRHKKTHLGSSERPHKCPTCHEGFLYPKDLQRHQRKHIDQPSAQVSYFCRYPGCAKLDGFSRRDNLLRHQRKQHAGMVAAA